MVLNSSSRRYRLMSTFMIMVFLAVSILPGALPAMAATNVVVLSPTNNQILQTNSSNTVSVSGYVTDVYPSGLTINDTVVYFDGNGSFVTSVALTPGSNTIKITASGSGGTITKNITVVYDDGVPTITIDEPVGTTIVNKPDVTVKGSVYKGTLSTVTLNGQTVNTTVVGSTYFSVPITNLISGLNRIGFTATNSTSSRTAAKDLYVIYDDSPEVTIFSPENDSEVSNPNQTISGTVYNCDTLDIYKNGKLDKAGVDISALDFTHAITLDPGENNIELVARKVGKTVNKIIKMTYNTGAATVYNITPATGSYVYSSTITVAGNLSYADSVTIVNGATTINPTVTNNRFSTTLTLTSGLNNISISPKLAGVAGTAKNITINYETTPHIVLNGSVALDTGADVAREVYVSTRQINLSGKVENTKTGGLTIGKGTATPETVTFSSTGTFSKTIDLSPGSNIIKIKALNSSDVKREITLIVRYNNNPSIVILSPDIAQDIRINASKIAFVGQVANTKTLKVSVNNGSSENVIFTNQGNFSKEVTLKAGSNTIVFKASDDYVTITQTIRVDYDDIPEIVIKTPKADEEIETNRVVISGTVINTDSYGLYIDDQRVSFDSNGNFSKQVIISPDKSSFTITARKGDKVTTRTVAVSYKGVAEIYISRPLDKGQVYSNLQEVKGQILGVSGDLEAIDLKINNKEVQVDKDGNFSTKITLKAGNNTISANAKLPNKKTLIKSIKVTYADLAMPGAVVESTIPVNGATLKLFEGSFGLKIPKGAFAGETGITTEIKEADDISKESRDITYVSQIISIEGNEPEKPVQLTLKYLDGMKEAQINRLGIYRYTDGAWEALGGKVDAKKQTVTLDIDQLGTYAVMAYLKSFEDTRGHWAQRDIEFLLAKGIATGRSGYYFYPNQDITRAEFAKMLVKGMGIQTYREYKPTFDDVSTSHWGYDYVQAATRVGIIKGVGTREFAPEKKITRAEAATMIARAANLKSESSAQADEVLRNFRDGYSIASFARGPIAEATKAGIIGGMQDGKFKPGERATRAQAAKMLVRLMAVEKRI